jgi:NADH dehydrogenase
MTPATAAAPARERVVIVGCGFGGLWAVRALARDATLDVTLIDRTNHHLFQPLLYQVATAGLSAPAVSAPVRHILRREMQRGNLTVLRAEVTDIDARARTVTLDDGSALPYDHLIVAAGATHSYFGNDHWAAHAPGLKTLADAFAIRQRVIEAFEQAERTAEPERMSWMTFAIIGGGPTGVELAGALAEIARHTLSDEFRHIDTRRARVLLLEGADRVLGAFDASLSAKAARSLQHLGVELRTGCKVTAIDGEGLSYTDAASGQTERIATRTVLWAAGVAGSPLGRALQRSAGAELDRAGRVRVLPDLTLAGHPEISVIGDLAAALSTDKRGRTTPVPGVSPAAKQMGRWAAANLQRRRRGEPMQPFRYADYGSLATIGRSAAVVQLEVPGLGQMRWSGFFAWLFWLFAHVYFLIGFRNRLIVLIDWAFAYFSFERHARVVAQPQPAPDAPRS